MDYVASVDQKNPDGVYALTTALGYMISILTQKNHDPSMQSQLDRIMVNLRRDGFEWDGERIVPATGARVSGAIAVTRELDLRGLHERINAAEKKVATDPAGAIGDAKELLEAVFRTIAQHHGIELAADMDVTEMFKAVRDKLVVLDPRVSDSQKGAAILKRLLGNLSGLCGTIAELRNAYGSGHGKPDGFVGLDGMHARLAVTTAGALAAFVLESDPKVGKT